jgi:hypothetical protein
MSGMVQVALASDVTEGEEIQALLDEAGIDSQLEPAVDHHPRETDDVPTKVLVAEASIEDALAAIEALSEPDEPGPTT